MRSPASVSTPRTPPSPAEQNSPHSRSGPDLDAQLGRESGQCPRHSTRASQGIPNSLTGLHVGDAAKYRGRRIRSRAHILREMIEHLGNTRVGHMRAHRRRHRPPRVQGEEVEQQRRFEGGLDVEHVTQTANRAPEEEAIRDAMQPGGVFHETPITCAGPRGESVETGTHLVDVGPQVEGRAVGEERAPLRVDSDQLQVVVEPPARLGEDAGQDRRQSENGRPHVEAEALLASRTAALPPSQGFFSKRTTVVTARGQGTRRRQTRPDPRR